jgi:hypothetical protein
MRAPGELAVGIGALGVDDAAPRGHPVHLARRDDLVVAQAVAVVDLALEQVGDGGQPDVRVRPHVHALPRQEVSRAHVVQEDEGPDHAALVEGQDAPDLQPAAEVLLPGFDDEFDHGLSLWSAAQITWELIRPSGRAVASLAPRTTMRLCTSLTRPMASSLPRRKSSKPVHVAGDHAQHVVLLAGDQRALHHLGPAGDGALEGPPGSRAWGCSA